jgi:hypothetical protein
MLTTQAECAHERSRSGSAPAPGTVELPRTTIAPTTVTAIRVVSDAVAAYAWVIDLAWLAAREPVQAGCAELDHDRVLVDVLDPLNRDSCVLSGQQTVDHREAGHDAGAIVLNAIDRAE